MIKPPWDYGEPTSGSVLVALSQDDKLQTAIQHRINQKIILQNPTVQWPNGLTIDFNANRVYWVDAGKDVINSVNLEGEDLKNVLSKELKSSIKWVSGSSELTT